MERTPAPERLTATMRRHPFGVDVALTVAFVLITVVLPGPAYRSPAEAVLFGLLISVPLAWRRKAPIPAAAAMVVVGLLQLVALPDLLLADVAVLPMIYSLAAYAPRWAAQTGLGLGLFGAVLAGLRYYSYGAGDALLATVTTGGIAVVAAWALGNLRRARVQRLAALEERARLLELERDQEMRLAAQTERARIARELHDVVAHSLSVVIAQADGGLYAGRTDPDKATGALEQIAATGRQALTDMRSLLGVLREDGRQEYAPQPDVAAIKELVEDVRTSGLDVDLIEEGLPQPMPAGPQLAAYRIVQESLTNVLKHAGPAGRAWVRLQWRDDALELSVLDDGRGAAAVLSDGQGQGLRGMVERAALHGGRLTAGPRHGGGFGVHAALPYRTAAR
ncbi:sensor histidine kinase [Petropleomorpha daqingensis]|uniref:histidine kinase n=1 Tax=Petropleomorpha daqingensis TaxID=2026353 RepID=A0A853CES8_9ACTN|nr:sensor histidine kinase [Petropleomorpha daqingensis]NYJ05666.1 signal transduction histidine kinase [Petropleomorpha daqingensis]